MAQTRTTIWVEFTQVGFHHWPDAPTARAYLRNPHRHLFHVEVSTTVEHDDRDIEFHDLRDESITLLRGIAVGKGFDFGSQSCETIARRLGLRLIDRYRLPFTITVSEDGECGATIEILPE